jgi:hypothetical protein
MKKVVSIFILALFLAWSPTIYAQKDTTVGQHIKTGAKKTGHAVKKGGKAVGKGAKKVGKKTAEVGSKTKAKVTDKEIKSKQGPNGETIYQDERGYYWIDKEGHKHYMRYGSLRDRT